MYYIYAMGSATTFLLMIIGAVANGLMYSKPVVEDITESLVEPDASADAEEPTEDAEPSPSQPEEDS